MKTINLGKDKNSQNIELDLEAEKINFILLAGDTGSGKSIFHFNFYRELLQKYSFEEIGLVLLDMTAVDFSGWQSDYLIKPVIKNAKEAIHVLNELSEIHTTKKVFIHIEECDMVYLNRNAVESALQKLKDLKNVYVVYSTSRIDEVYLRDWLKLFIDLKVVFSVSVESSNFLLGNDTASHFTKAGERFLAFNNKQILCQPFTDSDVQVLNNFSL